jgi:hypothetical protein
MSTRRRVKALEAPKSPADAVARWLAEAHAYPSLHDYVRAVIATRAEHPITRIERQVAAAPWAGDPEWSGRGLGRRADPVREALVRYELAIAIELAAEDFVDRTFFRAAFVRICLLERLADALEPRRPRRRSESTPTDDPRCVVAIEAAAPWAEVAVALAAKIRREEAIRRSLEADYLQTSVPFPDTADRWQELMAAVADLEAGVALLQQLNEALIEPRDLALPPPGTAPDLRAEAAAWLDEARVMARAALGEIDLRWALTDPLRVRDEPEA